MLKPLHRLLLGLSTPLMLLALEAGLATAPSQSAEKLTLRYGGFGRSVAVESLREYAQTGVAPADLASLLNFLNPSDRTSLRQTLNVKFPLDVVTVDRLARSPIGQQLLTEAAKVTIRPDDAGQVALRGALILAAASQDGLSVLSFLAAYPGQTLTLDVPAAQKLAKSSGGLQGILGSFLKPQ